MKHFSKKNQPVKVICIFSMLVVVFLPLKMIAQKNVVESDELIKKGLEAYEKSDYKTAAVYLFAYIQKNPSASAQVSPAYEFSYNRIITGIGAKSDGGCDCLKPNKNEPRPSVKIPVGGNSATTVMETPVAPAGSYSKIITGRAWTCNDGGTYYITRNNNEVWWYGKGSDGGFTNVMHGVIEGNLIKGKWSDVPSGNTKNSGNITLQIDDLYNFHVTDVSGGFGGSKWNTSKMPIEGVKDRVIKDNPAN